MDFTRLVGNVAVVCTVARNFTGVPVCRDVLKRKSTSGVSSLPFLTGAVSSLLWLQYGIMIENSEVTFVNVVSALMQFSFLACYFYVTSNKVSVTSLVFSSSATLLAILKYTSYLDIQDAVYLVGLLCCCSNIIVSLAPLSGIKEVFISKSTESIPFLIILGTFVVSTLWYIYGTLVEDSFIAFPNLIAGVISGIQLGLFAIYDSKASERKSV